MTEHPIITPRSEVRRDLLDRSVRDYVDNLAAQIRAIHAQYHVRHADEFKELARKKLIPEAMMEQIAKLYRLMAEAVRENKMPPEAERCTVADAERILDGWVFGPEDVYKVFDVYVDEDEAAIPYTRMQLEQAREDGAMLVYRVCEDAMGMPLNIQHICHVLRNKLLIAGEAQWMVTNLAGSVSFMRSVRRLPKHGWKLVTRAPVPKSPGRDYFGQTKILRQFIEKRLALPPEQMALSRKSILEEERRKYRKNRLPDRGDISVTEDLAIMPVNANHRRNAAELLYDVCLSYFSKGKLLLPDHLEDTNTATVRGEILGLGFSLEERGMLSVYARTSFLDENPIVNGVCAQW